MGVLFENSIVCHVFYAIVGVPAGSWFVLGVGGCACFVFGFACACLCGGCGLGLEFFSLKFCLESLILAQDERWRRA